VPPPGAAIEDPIGAVIEPIGGAEAGCVVDPVGVGVLDVLPQAVGCGLAASDPLVPGGLARAPWTRLAREFRAAEGPRRVAGSELASGAAERRPAERRGGAVAQ